MLHLRHPGFRPVASCKRRHDRVCTLVTIAWINALGHVSFRLSSFPCLQYGQQIQPAIACDRNPTQQDWGLGTGVCHPTQESCVRCRVKQAIEILFHHTWWQFSDDTNFFASLYHYFNLAEAAVWFVLGALVALRFFRFRHSNMEIVYSIAFLAFGVSDVLEAWKLTSWLLWTKLVILLGLFMLRRHVIRTYYPEYKVY